MGLWLTEKIDEKISPPLKIKSTPTLKPLLINRLDTTIMSFIEALSFGMISLRNR
jgi:hypothetical protein